jgi:hypothetical protein
MVLHGKKYEHEYRRSQGYDQLGQTALDADHPPADKPHNEIGCGSKQFRHGETSLMASSREGQPSEQPAFSSNKAPAVWSIPHRLLLFTLTACREIINRKFALLSMTIPCGAQMAVVNGSFSTFRSIGTVY